MYVAPFIPKTLVQSSERAHNLTVSLFTLFLQVGMGTNNTLFALEDGHVRFTKEVYIPPPRSTEATQIITKLPQGAVLYKTFINVVPVKQEGKFKLVDMV